MGEKRGTDSRHDWTTMFLIGSLSLVGVTYNSHVRSFLFLHLFISLSSRTIHPNITMVLWSTWGLFFIAGTARTGSASSGARTKGWWTNIICPMHSSSLTLPLPLPLLVPLLVLLLSGVFSFLFFFYFSVADMGIWFNAIYTCQMKTRLWSV